MDNYGAEYDVKVLWIAPMCCWWWWWIQADPGFGDEDSISGIPRDPKNLTQLDSDPDGYRDYLLALRTEVLAFGKPVAYVHGDSHYGRIDKPFLDANGEIPRQAATCSLLVATAYGSVLQCDICKTSDDSGIGMPLAVHSGLLKLRSRWLSCCVDPAC